MCEHLGKQEALMEMVTVESRPGGPEEAHCADGRAGGTAGTKAGRQGSWQVEGTTGRPVERAA